MVNNEQFLAQNQNNFQYSYRVKKQFLQYPDDWLIRFHNIYMKKNIPAGRVLDYGYGTGNNSVFFIDKGYEVYGTEIADGARDLVKANLIARNLDLRLLDRFYKTSTDPEHLPFADDYFEFIVSNQALYYLPSESYIRKVCKELSRCLRPGGVVFFTMMGPKNYYITEKTARIHDGNIHEIIIEDKTQRLHGTHRYIYLASGKDELVDLFSDFECIDVGYFDQKILDITSNFHWIFIGKKPS